jgi:hypothetical protein
MSEGAIRRGARRGARFLKIDQGEATLTVGGSLDLVRDAVAGAMGARGRVVSQTTGQLTGVVKSGALDMNPAVLMVDLTLAGGGGKTRVVVRGWALEGLIKQRAGQKAVARLVESLGG